ncbi:MAG TPA: HAD family hydrolase [Planctomycetota bacterium]|nr:HAD family hydrolase [Planctomycetota bacterium]
MLVIDDRGLERGAPGLEVVRPVGLRRITHAIHDIDGTHSLIRDWPPVMSLSIHWAMTCGLRDDFDSPAQLRELIARVGREKLEETDRFCVESAGLSALTQMEFGIRRAIELGNVPADPRLALSVEERRGNSEIIRRIWAGQERFLDVAQPAGLIAFIAERSGRLFKLYEAVLNGACRDRNTADARKHPAKWRVPGALEFMERLHAMGCRNYFVTGAVLYAGGGMLEEVEAVGFEVGPGKAVEALLGSSWDRKMPKDEVMRELFAREGIDPKAALVIGDGRTEIAAGASFGSVCLSRLPEDARRQRELHRELGTNYILRDYTVPELHRLLRKE